jgi:dTDP-4-amino-4,6-dideoxygalactose transaminase
MVATNDEKLADKIRETVSGYKYNKIELLKKIIATYLEKWFLPTPLSFPVLYLLSFSKFKKIIEIIYRNIQKPPSNKYRYTEVQSYLGIEKLKNLEERNVERREKANLLKSLLNENIKPQIIEEKTLSNYYFFVALLNGNIKEVRQKLLFKGIDAGIENEIADDCSAILSSQNCPNSNKVFKHAIQLPLYEDISEHKIKYIAETFNGAIIKPQ